MVRGVRVMRYRALARQRRAMSPDLQQVALQTTLSSMVGVCGWHCHKIFPSGNFASVRVVILLDCGFDNDAAARAAVDYVLQELEDVVEVVSVVVTFCDYAFLQCVHADDDDDYDDDNNDIDGVASMDDEDDCDDDHDSDNDDTDGAASMGDEVGVDDDYDVHDDDDDQYDDYVFDDAVLFSCKCGQCWISNHLE
jgi:hypothetical protein